MRDFSGVYADSFVARHDICNTMILATTKALDVIDCDNGIFECRISSSKHAALVDGEDAQLLELLYYAECSL